MRGAQGEGPEGASWPELLLPPSARTLQPGDTQAPDHSGEMCPRPPSSFRDGRPFTVAGLFNPGPDGALRASRTGARLADPRGGHTWVQVPLPLGAATLSVTTEGDLPGRPRHLGRVRRARTRSGRRCPPSRPPHQAGRSPLAGSWRAEGPRVTLRARGRATPAAPENAACWASTLLGMFVVHDSRESPDSLGTYWATRSQGTGSSLEGARASSSRVTLGSWAAAG